MRNLILFAILFAVSANAKPHKLRNVDPIGGSATWGQIIGTLANQTDLNTALTGKQTALPWNIAGDLVYYNGSAAARLALCGNGQVLGVSAGAWTCLTASGSGTVTSVGLSLPGIFSVSGSPVTAAGTLTGALATQSANTFFAGPTTGAASSPTFRTMVGADLPVPGASSLGGVESYASVTHQWINAISTAGVPSSSQPAFTDISGVASASQIPNPSATTLGGTESYAAVTHQWLDSISTSGVPHSSQPAFTDISGTASTGQIPDLSATYLPLAGGALTGDVKKGNCYVTPKESDLGNSGATLAVDLSTATVFTTTLTASATITFSNPVAGCAYALVLTQDATGSRTVTWAGTTALWGAAGTKTLSTAASAVDKINCVYDGASTKLLCDLSTSYQ